MIVENAATGTQARNTAAMANIFFLFMALVEVDPKNWPGIGAVLYSWQRQPAGAGLPLKF
ncbi:MAG: hypothetical protein JO200_20625 [Comamonas sp.]|nr:hypothetical protein [Comamonas sp.]